MKRILIIAGMELLAAVVLAACSQSASPVVPTNAPDGSTTTPTQSAQEVAPTTAPAEAAEDACVTCHTDKERLIETADAVVEEVEESKGAG